MKGILRFSLVVFVFLTCTSMLLAGPPDVPVGFFFPYDNPDLDDYARLPNQTEINNYNSLESTMYQNSKANYLINNNLPLHYFDEFGFFNSSPDMKVFCQTDPNFLPFSYSPISDSYVFGNSWKIIYKYMQHHMRLPTSYNAVTSTTPSHQYFHVDHIRTVYNNITKAYASNPHFGGYWMGEEPVKYHTSSIPLFTNQQIEDQYENTNAMIDVISDCRGNNPNAPIVTGHNPDEFLDKLGLSDPEYFDYIDELDDYSFIPLNNYGRVVPSLLIDFFYRVNRFDIFYFYDDPVFKTVNYDRSTPPNIVSYSYFNYQGQTSGSYQTYVHRYMYDMRWMADKIYYFAQQQDPNPLRKKEFWYMNYSKRQLTWDASEEFLRYDKRRYTNVEDLMMCNLALACGAKGVHNYTLSSSDYYGLDENNPGIDRGYEYPLLTQLNALNNNIGIGDPMRTGFLRGSPVGIADVDLQASDLRIPYDGSGIGKKDMTRHAFECTVVDDELLEAPFYSLSEMYQSDSKFYRALKTLRPMLWITTANAHDRTLLTTMYPNVNWDATDPRCNLVDDSLVCSYRESAIQRGGATYDTLKTDVSRIGVANHRFFLTDVTGEYLVDTNQDVDTRRHQTSCFRANSNITVGFFKHYEYDQDAQYYYFVNTRCHQQVGATIVKAADDEIQLVFDITSTGAGDPYNGTTWLVTDKVTGDSIGSFVYGAGTYTTPAINFEAGEGRLIEVTRQRTGTSGTLGANTTWSGVVHVTADVVVPTGITLTISPGTRVLFDDGCKLRSTGGVIDARGTATNRISFYPLGEVDRTAWSSIALQGGATTLDNYFHYCDFRGAQYAIACANLLSDIDVRYSTFEECAVAMQLLNSRKIYVRENHINNCGDGIYIINSSYYNYIYDNTIGNIDQYGIHIDDGYNVRFYGNLVQNCGYNGVDFDGIDYIYMDDGYARTFLTTGFESDNNPNVIRYNGYADPDIYCGIVVSDSYLSRLLDTFVYENLGTGFVLDDQASVNSSASYTNDLLLANNALKLSSIGGANIYNSQVLVNNGCDWDFYNKDYDFMDRYSSGTTPSDPTYHIAIMQPGQFDISYNFFCNDDVVLDESDIPNTSYFYKDIFTVIYCNDVNDTTINTKQDYWQTYDVNDPRNRLDLAYTFMDTLEDYEAAEEILEGLVNNGYVPALKAMCCVLRLTGEEPVDIASYLESIPIDSSRQDFDIEVKFAMAFNYRYSNEYDLARDALISIRNEGINIIDSLRVECELIEVNLKELAYEEAMNSGKNTQSIGQRQSRKVALEEKKASIRKQIYNYYNGIENEERVVLPSKFELQAAFPNPFNPSVTIPFALPRHSDIRLTVYNVLGQKVAKLATGKMQAGYHRVIWNGKSDAGLPVASGVYFVTMQAGNYVKTQKLVLMK